MTGLTLQGDSGKEVPLVRLTVFLLVKSEVEVALQF